MTLVYEVLQLEQEIEDKLSYHFLDENIMIDKINKSKLKSLTFVMRQSNFPKHIQDKYIIAITLVEIASEIHEQIKENDEIKDDHQDSLTKQLTVLGGDYYSSLYYMLLAELEDIKFIQHIATTIKRLNELKMDFHFFVSRDPNNYFTLRQKIESYIINSVAQYIEFNDENTLKTIERLLLVDLLHREKDFYETKNTFNYFKQDDIYDYLVEHIDMIIATYKKEIQMLLSTFNDEDKQSSFLYFNQLMNNDLVYMEEG
ncbi:MAG TPA: heptaprenyl diphosphate synthase component 1 [Bacillota bacterium]|nr:heptaprenyl diphosphate synthase component 1 [Bacillota bacterium]